jgi:hypothetical protein
VRGGLVNVEIIHYVLTLFTPFPAMLCPPR